MKAQPDRRLSVTRLDLETAEVSSIHKARSLAHKRKRAESKRAASKDLECPCSDCGVSLRDFLKAENISTNVLTRTGAPDPVARQTVQRDHSDGADAEQEGDETIGAGAVRPVMEALKHDERLGQALEAIAAGSGEEIDPVAISSELVLSLSCVP